MTQRITFLVLACLIGLGGGLWAGSRGPAGAEGEIQAVEMAPASPRTEAPGGLRLVGEVAKCGLELRLPGLFKLFKSFKAIHALILIHGGHDG